MRRTRNPARLVVALSVATTLAVFLFYTSLSGSASPSLQPSQLEGHSRSVYLVGLVVGPVRGSADGPGLRFAVRDMTGTARVPVLYHGSVPDLFRAGRSVYVRGSLSGGVFVAVPGTLVTKCPSKYVAKTGT
jgi:cytochrome c-type biogenesis protein CcmE